jgi:hypothetical protein
MGFGARRLAGLLGARRSAQADAEAIVEAALAAGGQDNATALVIDVVSLPGSIMMPLRAIWPLCPSCLRPWRGERGWFPAGSGAFRGRYTRLFRAHDTLGGQDVVVKFPKLRSENGARAAFTREMLVGSRVASPLSAPSGRWPPGVRAASMACSPITRAKRWSSGWSGDEPARGCASPLP